MSHAVWSPSSAHRWLVCTASVGLSRDIPREDSAASIEGTLLHDVAAAALLGKKHPATLTKEQRDVVEDYVTTVQTFQTLTGGQLLVEHPVKLNEYVYGTADAIIIVPDAGEPSHVFDLKGGGGHVVQAVGNPQLLTYGGAAVKTLGLQNWALDLHIVQPRRPDDEGNSRRTWRVMRYEALDFEDQLLAAIDKATEAPELVAGEHCTFCPARHTCPKLRETAMQAASDIFPALNPEEPPVAPPALETLSAERLAVLLGAADAAELWIKAVREHALDRARREKIPGHKIVAKLSNRKWIDEAEAAAKLSDRIDPWKPREVVSPAEAERRGGVRAMKPIVDALTERVVTGAVLVPESDKRPALPSTDDLFSLLPSED